MHTLMIKHLRDLEFDLVRLSDTKSAPTATLVSPYGFPIEGRPHTELMADLRWYLEKFLVNPFDPDTHTAERLLMALKQWGTQAFDALFAKRPGADFLSAAKSVGYEQLRLRISSNDPAVLSWPWEGLFDTTAGSALGLLCSIERRIDDKVADPIPIASQLPRERVNILLVTARPFEQDVGYRSISRRLVELVDEKELPASIHLLRPPTFDRLREHLAERTHYYHILHFDGHGAFGVSKGADLTASSQVSPYSLKAAHGHLIFEKADGTPDFISAATLSPLLREYAVPAVVLNACQSAMADRSAGNPFSSVAASLLQAGTRSVVAMAYSLYVSAAQEFLPAFYANLFKTGDIAEALRKGRQQMFARPLRVSNRGPYPLQDWLVPVAFQQAPLDFAFADQAKREAGASPEDKLPQQALEQGPYGFIGRDGLLLRLERAMRRRPGAILLHGMGGIGKTTLAQGFVKWLYATEGLGQGCIWLRFSDDIRSAEYIFNAMGRFLGDKFLSLDRAAKIDNLVRVFNEKPFVIVWDNFETAAGIAGTELNASLAKEQLALLRQLVVRLRGGRSKIIITSRSNETWLGKERVKIPIGGLDGEERWQFLGRVIDDLGIEVNREAKALSDLVDRLEGHPLAMQVILPMLEEINPEALLTQYEKSLTACGDSHDPQTKRFFATLHLAETSLPRELRPLLTPLALHERYVDTRLLKEICQKAAAPDLEERVESFAAALGGMGLLSLHSASMGLYEMHPALGSYLRSQVLNKATDSDLWARAFVDIMGSLADACARKPLHEQRPVFLLHGANFYQALQHARHMKMLQAQAALVQALAAFAQNSFNFDQAGDLFEQLAQIAASSKLHKGEALAYHQLGIIAQERRDFSAAEKWYRKSLAIKEKHGNEHGAAITYHQLGTIAEERHDFSAAEKWYRKSLAIDEKHGNEHGVAITYHQLGMITEKRRDFSVAEKWYRKSLAIKEKHGNEHGAAKTYGQLGLLGLAQGNHLESGRWMVKAAAGFARQNDSRLAAQVAHNFYKLMKAAPANEHQALIDMWNESGLDAWESISRMIEKAIKDNE